MTKRLGPLKVARQYCLVCCIMQAYEVRLCAVEGCSLHIYRFGRRPGVVEGSRPPSVLRAIRVRCLDCSGGSLRGVRDCWNEDCKLYPFRMGKNPHRAGMGDAERLRRWQQEQKELHSRAEISDDTAVPMELVTTDIPDV